MAFWTPKEITTLRWYRADSLPLSNNDTVNIWFDESGNEDHAVRELTAPVFKTGVQNGLPVVRFSGAGFLRFSSILNALASVGSIFVAYNCTSGSGSVLANYSEWSAFVGWQLIPHVDGYYQYRHRNSTSQYRIYNTGFLQAGVTRNGLDIIRGSDGSYEALAVYGNYGVVTDENRCTRIGASDYLTDYLTGDVAEIIILDNVPNEATRQNIEGYLAWKWGTESRLPAAHPYEDHAPYDADGDNATLYDVSTPEIHSTVTNSYVNPLWSPDQLDLALWLDASAPASVEVDGSSKIAKWIDKRYLPYTALPTNVSIPTYVTAAQNGLNAIRSGTNLENLRLWGAEDIARTTDGLSVYVAFDKTGGATTPETFDIKKHNSETDKYFYVSANGTDRIYCGATQLVTQNAVLGYQLAMRTAGMSILGGIADYITGDVYTIIDGKRENRVIGAMLTTGTTSDRASLRININGSGTSTSDTGYGDMGEILVFRSVLGSDDEDKVIGYLAWKWGSQGKLAVDHPYYDAAPEADAAPIAEINTEIVTIAPRIKSVEQNVVPFHYLIQSETIEGNTDFVDGGSQVLTVNKSGDVSHTTYRSKFGNSSIYLTKTGGLLYSEPSDHFWIDDLDFTIDVWVYTWDLYPFDTLWSISGQANPRLIVVDIGLSWTLGYYTSTESIQIPYGGTGWKHIAVVRKNSWVTLYLNGVAQGTIFDDRKFEGNVLRLGDGGSEFWAEEFRYCAWAEWDNDFDPPIAPYDTEDIFVGSIVQRIPNISTFIQSNVIPRTIIGGYPWTTQPLNTTQGATLGTLRNETPFPIPVRGAQAAIRHENRVVIFGGADQAPTYSAEIDEFGEIGTWQLEISHYNSDTHHGITRSKLITVEGTNARWSALDANGKETGATGVDYGVLPRSVTSVVGYVCTGPYFYAFIMYLHLYTAIFRADVDQETGLCSNWVEEAGRQDFVPGIYSKLVQTKNYLFGVSGGSVYSANQTTRVIPILANGLLDYDNSTITTGFVSGSGTGMYENTFFATSTRLYSVGGLEPRGYWLNPSTWVVEPAELMDTVVSVPFSGGTDEYLPFTYEDGIPQIECYGYIIAQKPNVHSYTGDWIFLNAELEALLPEITSILRQPEPINTDFITPLIELSGLIVDVIDAGINSYIPELDGYILRDDYRAIFIQPKVPQISAVLANPNVINTQFNALPPRINTLFQWLINIYSFKPTINSSLSNPKVIYGYFNTKSPGISTIVLRDTITTGSIYSFKPSINSYVHNSYPELYFAAPLVSIQAYVSNQGTADCDINYILKVPRLNSILRNPEIYVGIYRTKIPVITSQVNNIQGILGQVVQKRSKIEAYMFTVSSINSNYSTPLSSIWGINNIISTTDIIKFNKDWPCNGA